MFLGKRFVNDWCQHPRKFCEACFFWVIFWLKSNNKETHFIDAVAHFSVSGPAGVGKSSLVCSLAAAVSGERWRQHAYVGSYGEDGEPMTVFTET